MKNCMGCKFAEWKKTDAGKLHPSGDGKCTYDFNTPALPACMYWVGTITPSPEGGHINRRTEHKNHCPYYGT